MSSVLLGPAPTRDEARPSAPPASPPFPPGGPRPDGAAPRNNTLTVLAGVGVLLLAMGVGVLIGRSSSPKQSPAAPQVITVASAPSAGASATPTEASFASDWPSGSSGYTVQLQTLPESGTSVTAVEGAKSAASAKGAKAVGALESEEFTSLSAGSYVIYAGDYHKQSEAQKALAGLKKSFPGAKVIQVSNGAAKSGAPSESGGGSSKGAAGNSESHPAPPSVLKKLKGTKGKSYEEQSKALPNVVETG
jgi:hypothetical protein